MGTFLMKQRRTAMIFLMENWYLFIGIAGAAVFIGFVIGRFLKLPKATQIATVKEWLLYVCIEAEKQFASGTGQIKLRWVFDKFVGRFPVIAQAISFGTFTVWVGEVLLEMNGILTMNKAVRDMVESGGA